MSEHEKTVHASLDAYVQKLLAKSTVLKTRPATREEVKHGDGVVVVRTAARGE